MSVFSLAQQIARIVAAVMFGLWSLPSPGATLPPVTYDLFLKSDPGSRYSRYQRIEVERGQNPIEIRVNNFYNTAVHGDITVLASSTRPHLGSAFVNGRSYTVYGLPGSNAIGYVVDVKRPNTSHWLPLDLRAGERRIYSGSGYRRNLGVHARITFIKLNEEPLTFDRQSIRINELFTVRVMRNNKEVARASQEMTVILTAWSTTCRLTSDSTQNIRLPDVTVSAFPNVGSTSTGSETASFSVRCDDLAVTPFATLSDASDAANRGNTLTNTGSAEGIGVQLLNTRGMENAHCTQHIPCLFGPDSAAKGNQHQFQLSSVRRNIVNIWVAGFTARYIRTGTIKPGDVQARATITFSYQ